MSDDPQFPRMPWYPSSFQASTRTWPFIAKAVYRELLDIQWDAGGLPADPKRLQQIVGISDAEWDEAWPYVEPKMPVNGDGTRRNPRLEEHRQKAVKLSEKRSKIAKKGAEARWKK